ncbi:MAG: FHA domain-containing protein, partial [Planctomycetota bacterium]
MPIALVSEEDGTRRIPLVFDPFVLGREASSHLVVADPRVAERHATVRYLKGEHVLRAEAPVTVNGKSVPFFPLQDGDRVHLGEPGAPISPVFRFENRLHNAFVPPGASLAEAWMAHPAFAESGHGPAQYPDGERVAGRDPARCRRVADPAGGGDLVVKILGPVRSPADGDRHLRLLTMLAGSPHPTLALVVDGGLAPG